MIACCRRHSGDSIVYAYFVNEYRFSVFHQLAFLVSILVLCHSHRHHGTATINAAQFKLSFFSITSVGKLFENLRNIFIYMIFINTRTLVFNEVCAIERNNTHRRVDPVFQSCACCLFIIWNIFFFTFQNVKMISFLFIKWREKIHFARIFFFQFVETERWHGTAFMMKFLADFGKLHTTFLSTSFTAKYCSGSFEF